MHNSQTGVSKSLYSFVQDFSVWVLPPDYFPGMVRPWMRQTKCCCVRCLTCDTHMELVNMMRPSAGDLWCSRWTPFLHSLCKDTQRKGKNLTWRPFIVLLMKQWVRLRPVLMQPHGYKATAKIQVCLFFLSWTSFFTSQRWDEFLYKRYSWLPLGPTEAGVATPLVFSRLASGTDTNVPVKNEDFFVWKKFWSTLLSLHWLSNLRLLL